MAVSYQVVHFLEAPTEPDVHGLRVDMKDWIKAGRERDAVRMATSATRWQEHARARRRQGAVSGRMHLPA